ncbi:hypothetical protein, partial [Vibrio metschnikovii]|uniref:hypothetical protein n=1 Tax=Vibrio metschnikovii TaxID=28172 RepID=UPI002FC5CA35
KINNFNNLQITQKNRARSCPAGQLFARLGKILLAICWRAFKNKKSYQIVPTLNKMNDRSIFHVQYSKEENQLIVL